MQGLQEMAPGSHLKHSPLLPALGGLLDVLGKIGIDGPGSTTDLEHNNNTTPNTTQR